MGPSIVRIFSFILQFRVNNRCVFRKGIKGIIGIVRIVRRDTKSTHIVQKLRCFQFIPVFIFRITVVFFTCFLILEFPLLQPFLFLIKVSMSEEVVAWRKWKNKNCLTFVDKNTVILVNLIRNYSESKK